jgi:sulfur-carrier protein
MIRVVLPTHLRKLAQVDGELKFDVEGQATQRSVLDAIEAKYPMLRGTMRDHVTQKRRAFVRFYASEQDLSNEAPDTPLPQAVATGAEPFLVVGAMAGGYAESSSSSIERSDPATLSDLSTVAASRIEATPSPAPMAQAK